MTVTVFAPATVANIAVGFDILGFAVDALGDTITVSAIDERIVTLEIHGPGADVIPTDAAANTATVGLIQMIKDLGLPHGFHVKIDKGIPLGSGLGGSAASAVGGAKAASLLVDKGLSDLQVLEYALLGEAVASGDPHPDNAAPCLYGGLTFATAHPLDVVQLPKPDLQCVLVHPDLRIDTKDARAVLPTEVPLKDAITQTSNLTNFLVGLYSDDAERVGRACKDVLVEPHRARLIPGFHDVQAAALEAGAFAASISGAGPTMFALCKDGEPVVEAMTKAFAAHGLETRSWICEVGAPGARTI